MNDVNGTITTGDRALPATVSVSRMVGNEAELQGKVPLQKLDRLLGLLADDSGSAVVALQFGKDEEGRRQVSGEVSAELSVYCQRCLETMLVTLRQTVNLGLVESEEQAAELPEHLEPLLTADDEVHVFELVTDELLLALPIVSAHDNECGERKYIQATDEPQLAPRQKPFEDLANLLGKQ